MLTVAQQWMAPRWFGVTLLLSDGAATSAPPSTSDSERARASSAPPLPSRHDPWRFLRCVCICVIALAFRGVFSMLPDKHASTIAAVEEMRVATRTTPRLAGRVRGKVFHYGVAVPFIAVAGWQQHQSRS